MVPDHDRGDPADPGQLPAFMCAGGEQQSVLVSLQPPESCSIRCFLHEWLQRRVLMRRSFSPAKILPSGQS